MATATATATSIRLDNKYMPRYHRSAPSQDAASTASHLLQENHDKHHIFFNESGFHNHIAHHLLTLWALKASPEEIQMAYDGNRSMQRPPITSSLSVKDLQEPEPFMKNLGPGEHYNAYLTFFTNEIERLGWQQTLKQYVFAHDARAEAMLVRMFSGFLHPLIHLGFGIEFGQPAIIAEALAQAACHDDWIGNLLLPAEQAAAARSSSLSSSSPSITALLDQIHADPEIRAAPHWSDGNKIRDGILARSGDRMIAYASQVKVRPEEMDLKMAEMINAVAYYTAGAQRREKMVRFDFYFMHCVNSAVFFPAFLQQSSWLSEADRVRLLEWKIRMDLAMYASRKSPDILVDEIKQYKPKISSDWKSIEERVCRLKDDGHVSKLIRSLITGQKLCHPYDTREDFRVKHDDWILIGHMVIDSMEVPGSQWVRSAGFDEAWEDVPARL